LNPEVDPTPVDVPLTDPYVDPTTGKTVRDVAHVTPQQNGEEAAVEVVKQEVDPATGEPAIDPATGEPVKPKEETTDPCELHPERLGCMEEGETDDEELQTQDLGGMINPVSVGGSASCPADKQVSYLGKQLTVSFAPICQGATWLNPVVLAIAWLLAGYILIGAIREG